MASIASNTKINPSSLPKGLGCYASVVESIILSDRFSLLLETSLLTPKTMFPTSAKIAELSNGTETSSTTVTRQSSDG